VAWVLGFAVVGTALGGMAATLPDVIRQSGWGQEFLSRYSGSPEASIVDIFLELIIVSLAMTAAFYPVLATLRLRAEEVAGGAELVLSTAVGRATWAISHLALSLLGTVAVLAAGGAALGLAHGLGRANVAMELGRDNVATELGRVLVGALLHVPAAWLLAGIALLLFGALPRYAVAIAWAVLLYVQLIGEVLGPVFLGPAYSYQVANGLQSFHWIPKITSGGELTATPLLVLTGLTALLVATGLGAFRRRDVGAWSWHALSRTFASPVPRCGCPTRRPHAGVRPGPRTRRRETRSVRRTPRTGTAAPSDEPGRV
jgi:ABC-2 type transport system permease protein